jgi:GAF domain-containing protein
VTLSLKGANSPTRGRKLRSTGTKARARVSRIREPRADLEKKLAEALEQQKATAEILRIISTSPTELQSVLEVVARSAAHFCKADDVTIFELDGQELRATAHWGPIPQVIGLRIPCVRGHVAARTILERKPIQVLDLQAEIEEFPEGSAFAKRLGHRTTVGMPLLREAEAVGTIVLRRAVVDPFTDKQIALLKTFANQAVIAIENTRLLNELRQRTDDLSEALEQQTATSDVLQVISSSPGELQPVFKAMLESATRICEAKFGSMYLREGDAFRIVAMHNAPPAFAEARRLQPLVRPAPGTGLYRVASTKQVVHIVDIRAEQPYLEREPSAITMVERAGARTLLVVPMLKDDELIGNINIYRQEVRPFTDKQIELVKNFAAQAVIAIENTRLLKELRQRTDDLSEALEQQTATSEVLSVISSSPGDLQPVFQTMLANAVRLCDAKFGTMFRFDGAFFPAAMVNAPSAYAEFMHRRGAFQAPSGTILDRLVRTREVTHIADDATAPNPSSPARLGGARSTIAVPMFKDDELIGAVVIYRQEVRPFTDKQMALVTNFAKQAVIAIENTRLSSSLCSAKRFTTAQ